MTTTAHQPESTRPMMVCPTCEGGGQILNRNFDGMSLSLDAFDGNERDYEDFIDNMREGVYNVRCDECGGQNVVRTPCECDDCEREREEEAMYEMERRMEMRMGC